VKIDLVELRRVAMPLVAPFRTSFGTETARDVLLVRVEGPDTAGWGECVAMTEPLYSSEYVEAAHAVLRDHLLPRLAPFADEVAPGAVAGILRDVKGHRMAKASLEMAVLDGQLSREGVSLAGYLGAVETSVASGVSVGIAGSLDELLETVGGYLDEGYVRIKLKIEPGWDVEPVAAVRRTFGDELALQVDANAAYTLEDAAHLRQLDPYGLLLIEQPLAEEDIAGHVALADQVATAICLDESITSAATAVDAIERGACSVVNIKAGRVGGYLEAKALHDVCFARGVPVWCGGMLETGIGRAANLALAALPGFKIPGDISASDRYWSRDLTEPFVLEDGRIRVPDGVGLGVRVDPEILEEHTTRVEQILLRG
jgi:o-succinylbenzoate synthase